MTVHTRLSSIAGALIGSLILVMPVIAHDPTVGDNYYPNLFAEEFDWAAGADEPPDWLRPAFKVAAEDTYSHNNHTRAPTFTYDAGLEDNFIRYMTDDDASGEGWCPDPATNWDACFGPGNDDRLRSIIYNEESGWCDDPEYPLTTGCLDVERVALHELGHAAGLARGNQHPAQSVPETYTVMKALTPKKATTGWTRDQLQRCDLIELQREYDITPLSEGYADCVDHLPAAGLRSGLIKTYITLNDPVDSACVNTFVTLSGTALIANEPTSLGLIAGNPLSERNARIMRRTGAGSFSLHKTDSIANTGAWSTTVTSSTATTYEYRTDLAAETAVSSDESVAYTIQWRTSFC